MPTSVSTGASSQSDSRLAAEEATKEALSGLSSETASVGFLFAGPNHDLGAALSAAKNTAKGVDLIGSTTAGEFTEKGLIHSGLVVLLVGSDDLTHQTSFATGMKAQSNDVASKLCSGFESLRTEAMDRQQRYSTTVLLTDGLSGTGEQTVDEVVRRTGGLQQVVGGAAGDEGSFDATWVGNGEGAAKDAAAALHVFGAKAWGIGVGHGLKPASEKMRVTKVDGNVVYEIDGKPAFEAYKKHAKDRGVDLDPSNASAYLIGNELGLYFFDEVKKARAPLSVGADGSLTCAASIPERASVCILDGEPESMVSAAREAAREAKAGLNGDGAAGVLVFDCVCRGMILKDQFQKEIDGIRSELGDVPVAGFLTYGEIARYRGKLDGWHNTTAVVVAIPA